ncbi:MFS general substrate transporter [Paxillus ammoniavirescens]|nr:MFS general substrate transporter [Paxillus ammoniavirescens]
MSPTWKRSSDTRRGAPDPGDLPQRKELGSGEDSVAPALTTAQETKLWRKIDLRLIPTLALMALLSTMDRGNAKLDGLITQLNLTGDKFNVALCMLDLSRVQNSAQSQVLWGLVMMLMGFVKTYPQLVGVRVCLGATEAGFYPGVAYCLTIWYPKYKYQYRMALLTAAAALAGACSGLLAYAIGFMNGDGGLEGWSWIFILQGAVTMLVGLISAFILVDYPSTAKFLTAEERSFIIEKRGKPSIPHHRFLRQGQSMSSGRDDAQDEEHDISQQVWAAFTDWQVWALSLVQISIAIPAYGITYFLPFGYSIPVSQLLTIPPYVLGAVAVLVFAHFSDNVKLRSPFIFAAQSAALLGYIINISDAPSGVKYFGTYLCIISSYAGGPGPVSWLANNLQGKYKRAVGLALQIGVGCLGGLVGSNIFRDQDEPRYLLGHGLAIMFITTGLIAIPIIVLTYKRLNARLDREERQQGWNAEHKESNGDRAPGFRYTL